MESSPFNLKESVDNYVNSIKNQGSTTSSDDAELKSHLYDAIDSLVGLGLAEEEAFIIARKRLGDEETLAQEYSKVNPSVRMNLIWSYLLLGFNLFYSLPVFLLLCLSLLYIRVYQSYNSSLTSTIIITGTHLLIISLVWFIVRRKFELSRTIEKQIQQHPLRTVSLSFIPLLLPTLINLIPALRISASKEELQLALRFPVYRFDSSLA